MTAKVQRSRTVTVLDQMLCWEIREVTTDRQGKARLWRNSSQTKELGQDAAGNRATEESRAGFHSKCLLSTNNVVGTIICYGVQRWIKT